MTGATPGGVVMVASAPSSDGFWLAVVGLLAATVVGFIVAMRARARALERNAPTADAFGFSELRALRDAGKITESEFSAAELRLRDKARETVDRARAEQVARVAGTRGKRR